MACQVLTKVLKSCAEISAKILDKILAEILAKILLKILAKILVKILAKTHKISEGEWGRSKNVVCGSQDYRPTITYVRTYVGT